MDIVLVEPDYYTRFPPLGLLKISTYHKRRGDRVKLVRVRTDGLWKPAKKPSRVYVTSLFTWSWRPVWKAVRFYKRQFPKTKVWLGGLYGSLMRDHASRSGADVVHDGVLKEAENLPPDYTLVPEWDGSLIFSSRGCDNSCAFCAVPRLEGKLNSAKRSIKRLVHPRHTRIILLDNNFLQSPHWRNICNELEELDKYVDFNQGLDARLITDEVAKRLSNIKLQSGSTIKIRLAYDRRGAGPVVEKAIDRLERHGIRRRDVMVYVLYNYKNDPEDFFQNVRDVLNWGAVAYPMRYEPLNALRKNRHIDRHWTLEQLEMVQDARRVLGFGGALPPYGGLVEKFDHARSFGEAFSLMPAL
jgi:hypothetical protein